MDAQIAQCLAFGSLSHRPESLDLTSGVLLFSGVLGCPSSTLYSFNSKPGTLAFLYGALGALKETSFKLPPFVPGIGAEPLACLLFLGLFRINKF